MGRELTKKHLDDALTMILGGRHLAQIEGPVVEMLFTCICYSHDVVLNELERRGLIPLAEDGAPMLPYLSEHMVETILTRGALQ